MGTLDKCERGQCSHHYDRAEGTTAGAAAGIGNEGFASLPKEWPCRPASFQELLTPIEAAQYLRLDETGRHTPKAAIRNTQLLARSG